MEAKVRQRGHVSVVDVSGKITLGDGDQVLRDRVHELLESGHPRILLNLENVTYMDAGGVGELIASRRRVTKKNGTVKLLKPSMRVYTLLKLTKLEKVFETYRSEKEALASFSGPSFRLA